jgi:hypothetical protein
MGVLATAGGGGEAADLCFFCPVFVLLLATVVIAFAGAIRGSVGAVVIAVLMAGSLGALVLYAAATLEPSDDPDEKDTRRLMWSMVVLWAVSAVIAIGSAGWAAARRLRKPASQGAAAAVIRMFGDQGRSR